MNKMPWVRTANGGWTQVSTARRSSKAAPVPAPVVPTARPSVNALLREMLRGVPDSDPHCGLLKRALAA